MKKRRTHHEKRKISQNRFQQRQLESINQIPLQKRQKWILINKNEGKISGMLDHQAFNTRESAKEWFQSTSSISGETIKISDFYYVLKVEEYEFLKELDVLDIITDQDIN